MTVSPFRFLRSPNLFSGEKRENRVGKEKGLDGVGTVWQWPKYGCGINAVLDKNTKHNAI